MDMHKMFEPVRNTAMPDETRLRILNSCRNAGRAGMPVVRKTVLVAAMIIAALCVTAAGTVKLGFFRDAKNVFGAVTGTEYLNASEEIQVSAVLSDGYLLIDAEFTLPDQVPYRYSETLGIGDLEVFDAQGNILFSGTVSDFPVENGRSEIRIPTDGWNGTPASIEISSFTSFKKADQPLPVGGQWTAEIKSE